MTEKKNAKVPLRLFGIQFLRLLFQVNNSHLFIKIHAFKMLDN